MTRTPGLSAWRPLLIYGSVALALCFIFIPMALLRLVDPDEGFYVIAARLVAEGKLPYRDFFYPQMPGLPYIYGAWMNVFGVSWYAARLLSSIFAILSGLLLYAHIARVTGQIRFGLLAVFLYALSSLSLGWLTSVRTYSLSTCMLLCAYVLVYHGSGRLARYGLGGLFLGVAVDARLQFAIFVPLFIVAICIATRPARQSYAHAGMFLSGLGLSLAPNLWLMARYPDQYIFNNIGYHAIRSPLGLVGDGKQKWEVLGQLFGIGSTNLIFSLEFALLSALSLGLAILCLLRGQNVPLSFPIAALLLVVNILPTPAYAHYFSTASHFLVISGTLFLYNLWGVYERRKVKWSSLTRYVVVSAAIYGCLGLFEMYRYTTYNGMLGVGPRSSAMSWRIASINTVGAIADQESELPWALSWWPGYFLETRTSILPRMENQFGIRISAGLTADQLTKYHIISNAAIVKGLASGAVNVAVLDSWPHAKDRAFYRRMLRRYGYVLRRKVGTAEIYRWDKAAEIDDVIIERDEGTPGYR